MVFSVIDAQSYKNASRKLQFIRQDLHFDIPVFLVANKVDLARTRVVSEKGGNQLQSLIFYFKIQLNFVFFPHLFNDPIISAFRLLTNIFSLSSFYRGKKTCR